jgi:hypothetical protein
MDLGLQDSTGPAVWQVFAALAGVLALLILVLRGLQRWQPGQRPDARVRLLSVQRLGPRRELQVLRVGDEVHTLYRQEGAMVVLGSRSWDSWSAVQDTAATPAINWKPRLRALVAVAGGRAREAASPPAGAESPHSCDR